MKDNKDIKDLSSIDLHNKWIQEIESSERYFQDYQKTAKTCLKAYKGKSDLSDSLSSNNEYNVFWANVQTLQPLLYSQPPKVIAERRYKDQDPLGRIASTVIERATSTMISNINFDDIVKSCRDDRLIVGRGVCFIRYVPFFQPTQGGSVDAQMRLQITDHPSEDGEESKKKGNKAEDVNEEITEELIHEEVCLDYIDREEFLHDPATRWENVRWVARKAQLTKDEIVKRFGEEIANELSYDQIPSAVSDNKIETLSNDLKKTSVYEIWDKSSKKVYWISKDAKQALDVKDDPLRLHGFFPCPKPLFAGITTDSLEPTPDYIYYKSLADQLTTATKKINLLLKPLRVFGVYDASIGELERLFTDVGQNKLIPVQNYSYIAEKGGLNSAISWFPIEQIIKVLRELIEVRDRIKRQIDEITGLSDIIRGVTAASETATAQQIKSNYAGLRLQDKQREVQTFVRDLVRLISEVIVEHFQPETIALLAGYDFADPLIQQNFGSALQLLKNDTIRSFRIDIETDSTISQDQDAEKQQRTQFLTTLNGFIQQGASLTQTLPGLFDFFGEALLYFVRGFSGTRNLEASLESALQVQKQMMDQQHQAQQQAQAQQAQAQQQPQQPLPPPPPTPADILKQQELNLKAQEMQILSQSKSRELDLKGAELQNKNKELDLRDQEAQARAINEDRAHQVRLIEVQAQVNNPQPQLNSQALAPIHVNVHALNPTKKVISLARSPDGTLNGQVQEL